MSSHWTDRPFSIMGHVFDYFLLPEDPAEQVRLKRGLGFDAEHWLGSVFKTGGDDGRSWLFRTRHGFLEDRLGPYLQAAHQQGLRVLVYVNAHWFSDAMPAEMFARGPDGQRLAAYGAGHLTCPAGPFLDYMVALAEDLGEYEVDGAFLDGPLGSLCWCDHCRAEYRRRFGEDMPSRALSLAQRRRLEDWAAEKVATFVGRFRSALRDKQPRAVVYHNGSSLGQLTWANRRTIAQADLLGIEGGFIGYRPLGGQFLYKTSATGKLLEALAGGKPTVVFNDHAFKGFDYWPLPRAELDLLYAATLAAGANPWYLIYLRNLETRAAEAARYWNGFIAAHRDVLAGTAHAEKIALLFSDTTMLVSRSSRQEEDSVHAQAEAPGQSPPRLRCDHQAAFQGAYALLARSGVGFRLLTERDLAGSLSGIKVVIAPSVVALPEHALAALEWFVESGGTLLADDTFAALDEDASPRDVERLGALLGGVPSAEIPAAQADIDYIARGRGWLFRGIGPSPLPRPARAYRLEKTGGRTLACFHEPLAGRYDHLPPVSTAPAALEKRRGSGRTIYFAMNLFEHYHAFGFDEHRQMVMNALRRHHAPVVEADGLDGRGEVFVRTAPGRLLVHLLNYGGAVRPFAKITPLRGVRVLVRDAKVRSARALHAGKDLPVRTTRRGCVVRLPRLGPAETIMLQTA